MKNICDNSEVPVYAIGGMTKEREPEVMRKGASGICIMSGCMREITVSLANSIWLCYNGKYYQIS